MFLEDKADGEPSYYWPDWFIFDGEPLVYAQRDQWGINPGISYVVLPQEKK